MDPHLTHLNSFIISCCFASFRLVSLLFASFRVVSFVFESTYFLLACSQVHRTISNKSKELRGTYQTLAESKQVVVQVQVHTQVHTQVHAQVQVVQVQVGTGKGSTLNSSRSTPTHVHSRPLTSTHFHSLPLTSTHVHSRGSTPQ